MIIDIPEVVVKCNIHGQAKESLSNLLSKAVTDAGFMV